MPKEKNAVNLLHRLTQSSYPVRLFLTLVGASLFITVMILLIVGGVALDKLLGRQWELISPVSLLLGSPVLLVALYFMLWSAGKFFLSQGSPVPMNPPKKLVVTGLYRYTRNPMQTGVYGVLIGFGVLLQSPGTLALALLWMVLLTWWLVAIEEPELEKRLGQDYLDYKRRVPRWGIGARRREYR